MACRPLPHTPAPRGPWLALNAFIGARLSYRRVTELPRFVRNPLAIQSGAGKAAGRASSGPPPPCTRTCSVLHAGAIQVDLGHRDNWRLALRMHTTDVDECLNEVGVP